MGTTVQRPRPGVATLLSHGGMVLPIAVSALIRDENSDDRRNKQLALVGLGVTIGPALGYWYGDLPGRGTRGAVGRLACVAVAGGAYLYLHRVSEPSLSMYGIALVGLGAAGTAGVWALWDAATVAPRVAARNREAGAVSWGVVPAVTPSGAPGLAVAARF